MIHSARPTVLPEANIVLALYLFCFEKWGRTDGRTNRRHVQMQLSLPAVTVDQKMVDPEAIIWRVNFNFFFIHILMVLCENYLTSFRQLLRIIASSSNDWQIECIIFLVCFVKFTKIIPYMDR